MAQSRRWVSVRWVSARRVCLEWVSGRTRWVPVVCARATVGSALALLLLPLIALAWVAPAVAQDGKVPECTAADLDVTFSFHRTSDHFESIVFHVHNISGRACVLQGGGPGAIFDDFKDGHNIWATLCFACTADGKQSEEYGRVITLPAGGRAHKSYRWAAVSTDPKMPCLDADGLNTYINSDMNHEYLVIARSLITRVCSVVEVSTYALNAEGSEHGDMPPGAGALKLTADKTDNIQGELVELHVEGQTPAAGGACAPLFFRARAESGSTRFEERDDACAKSADKTTNAVPLRADLHLNDGFGMTEAGNYTLEVSELAGWDVDGTALLARSKPLEMRFADPATLQRAWSPREKGLGIALNLDRELYEVGQDVHLHTVVEDFEAKPAIYSSNCSLAVSIEVRDAEGKLVPSRRFTPGYPIREIMTCHLGRTSLFAKHEPVPMESTLREWAMLPDQPGEYTVTATWTALRQVDGPIPKDSLGIPLEIYAVVRTQPVRFRIRGSGE